MNFWLRNIIIGLILAVIAFALITNMDFLMSLGEEASVAEEAVVKTNGEANSTDTSNSQNSTTKAQVKKTEQKANKNAAAEGLSRFYASLNPDLENKGPKIRNGVVYLPDPKGDLTKFMEARRMVTRPLPKKWQGIKRSYAFREGETLYQKLSEYAKKEGLDIIWRINRDLVVKGPFRINKEITRMSLQIGQALNGQLEGGVTTYFCYKHRAIVFVEYPEKYLEKQCLRLKPKTTF